MINDNQANIQNSVNSNETVFWETRNDNLTGSYNYTENAYPRSTPINSYEVLTINYYDTYGFDSNTPYVQRLENPASNSPMTNGLLTGSKVKVIDSNIWLTTVTYYDDKGKPLQVSSSNILGTWDKMTSKYDFIGKVIKSERIHANNSLTITNHYIYDHAGRKKEVYQQMNSEPEVELAEYNYNELGQLVKKNLHGNTSSHLQLSLIHI